MYTVLKLHSALESNHETDVAPGENEFDTPVSVPHNHPDVKVPLSLFQR